MSSLLCAVDFSLGDWTVRFAAVFARVTGSAVLLFHVRERGDGADAAARLAALALTLEGTGLAVRTESEQGDPAAQSIEEPPCRPDPRERQQSSLGLAVTLSAAIL